MSGEDLPPPAPRRCDLAIVGGGILGLAVAREMALRHRTLSICVLERESTLGQHQTGHNSGVIHAGIHYLPGSLKARLCLEGARDTYEYCEERGIPHERSGKVILATDRSELAGLHELHRRGIANGVAGLMLLDGQELTEREPHAQGLAGLYSPNSGIVDFAAVARSYAEDLLQAGGGVFTSCEVTGTRVKQGTITLLHRHGGTQARHAIFCGGAWSDRLAVAAGAEPDPRILPFKGAYLRLKSSRAHLVRSLIYPLPDRSLPFLGVHLTRSIDGAVLIGPTALLSLSRAGPGASSSPRGGQGESGSPRDGQGASSSRMADLWDTLSWPGSWRMFARFWRTGLTEIHHALSERALVKAAARLLPELQASDVEPGFVGVRAQALHRDGRLVDDFVFSRTERALHVRNAPSPAATSSLAIGRHVVEQAEQAFSLQRTR